MEDGFTWKKVGENRDKSISYYVCSDTGCCSRKKINHINNRISYKSKHLHDPLLHSQEKKIRISPIFSKQKLIVSKVCTQITDPIEANYKFKQYSRTRLKDGTIRFYYKCKHKSCNCKKVIDKCTIDKPKIVNIQYIDSHNHPIDNEKNVVKKCTIIKNKI